MAKTIKVHNKSTEFLIFTANISYVSTHNSKSYTHFKEDMFNPLEIEDSFDSITKQLLGEETNCADSDNKDNIESIFKDKQLVWAWDGSSTTFRILCFYDAINNCVFSYDGKRNCLSYENYLPYEGEYPEWAKKTLTKLDD